MPPLLEGNVGVLLASAANQAGRQGSLAAQGYAKVPPCLSQEPGLLSDGSTLDGNAVPPTSCRNRTVCKSKYMTFVKTMAVNSQSD